MIDIADCKPGYLYRLKARNIRIGIFTETANGPRPGFIGIRTKFGNRFLETELHYDADPHFGTATPLEELVVCPVTDQRTELGTICGQCQDEFGIEAPVDYLPYPDGPRTTTCGSGDKEWTNTYPSGWQHTDEQGRCTKPHGRRLSNKELFQWLDQMGKQFAPEEEA